MKTLSMLEFRKHAKRALLAVKRGERIMLTYRGRPVARLEPVRANPAAASAVDALLRLDDYVVNGPRGRVSNKQIDRVVYGA